VPQVCRTECRLMCRTPAPWTSLDHLLLRMVRPSSFVARHVVAVAVCGAKCEEFFIADRGNEFRLANAGSY
jgi:hypothetical protein